MGVLVEVSSWILDKRLGWIVALVVIVQRTTPVVSEGPLSVSAQGDAFGRQALVGGRRL